MNKHKGTTVDSFLEEEGILESTEAAAVKRIIAYELGKKMKKDHLNKTEMAEQMKTSRSALERLLDPNNTSITLNTLAKAAHMVGKRLHVSLV
jgi:predicted double-glycine peptidase